MTAFEKAFNLLKFKVPFTGSKNDEGNRLTTRFNWYDDYDFDGDEPFHGGQDFGVRDWSKPHLLGEAGLASGGQGMTYLEPIISDVTGVPPGYTFDEEYEEGERDSPHLTDEEIEGITNKVGHTSFHEAIHSAMEPSLSPLFSEVDDNMSSDDLRRLYQTWHEYGAITGSAPNPFRQYLELQSHPALSHLWPEFKRRQGEFGEITRDTGGYDSEETKQAIAEWRGRRAQANAAEKLFDTVQDVYE